MIYDCFPFFNELDLLEIRLNTLCDVVDKFVIVESAKTHRGNDKPLYFQTNKERFANFLDKIIYVQCVFPPEVKSSWGRENYQRNKIADGLYDAKDDDYIILSDLDEIPSVQAIEYAKKTPRTVSVFDQRLFFYFLNCENKNNKWCGTVMYPYLLFKNGPVQSARKIAIMMNALLHDRRFPYFLKTELEYIYITRIENIPIKVIKNAGWHFTSVGNISKIREKRNAIVEDYAMPDDKTAEAMIANGINIFDGKKEFSYVTIDDTFPAYLQHNKEKYKSILR